METKLTDLEKEIINRLVTYIDMEKEVNLSILAKECHVVKSTVVKTAKKLGCTGFVELYYQLKKEHREKQKKKGVQLQKNLLIEDLEESLDKVAELLHENRHRKNVVISFKATSEVGNYLARKLMMLDLFAPASYDYDITTSPTMEHGVFFLIDIKIEVDDTLKEALKVKEEKGYKLVVLSERDQKWLRKASDIYLQIKETKYNNANFTEAKAIIFCELLLAHYSQKYLKGERNGN